MSNKSLAPFLSACLALLSLALASLCCAGRANAQPNDNKNYCRTGSTVIFLLDITTPYDQTDKDAIVRATDSIFLSLKGGEKLMVRTIGDSHTHSERLIERCMPYCAASGTFGRLFECSDGVIRTDSEHVRAEVISALKLRLNDFEELKHSDIVRTIYSVVNENASEGGNLKLYIYSDLIENSDYFSPRFLFSYPLPRLIYGLHYYKLIANLRGAEVYVSGVGRSDSKDRRPLSVKDLNKLTEFWRAYFKECGAARISISQN